MTSADLHIEKAVFLWSHNVVRQVQEISAGTPEVFFWLLSISVARGVDLFLLFIGQRCLLLTVLRFKVFLRPCKRKTSCDCVKRGSELVNRFFVLHKRIFYTGK